MGRQGLGRQRVLVPPSPETLKTIKNLVAGVTGFNAERGDQLIVDTLPFESSLNAEPPATFKPVAGPDGKTPPWLQFVTRYRDLWAPAGLGLVFVITLPVWLLRSRKKAPSAATVSVQDELEGPAAHAELSPAAAAVAGAVAGPGTVEENNQLSERVRMVAKREPDLTANVLRMWLQESRG